MVACAAVSIAGFALSYVFVEDRRGIAMDASERTGEQGGELISEQGDGEDSCSSDAPDCGAPSPLRAAAAPPTQNMRPR